MLKLFSYGDSRRDQSLWSYLTASAILISLDQSSKYFYQESSRAFTNQQGSFSIPAPLWLIVLTSIVILTALSHTLFKKNTPTSMLTGLIFLVSGGVSNLIDRLLNGYVQDIIAISSARTNLADIYIIIGALLFLIGVYQSEPKPHKPHSVKSHKA